MPETWRMIADDLASRLQYQADAAGSVSDLYPDAQGCAHKLWQADPDCPFCEDRRAYRRYLAKREKSKGKS